VDPLNEQEICGGPAVGGKTGFDLVRVIRPNNQQDISGAFQRASQQDKALLMQRVHEIRVRVPTFLAF